MKTNLPVRPPLPNLPQEVILQIVDHLDHAPEHDPQRTLWAVSLLNRNWYSASIEALYKYPRLSSKNYDCFVDTVCPSINAHVKKTELASMVKVLDLSQLVFAGTKSFIARLLRRIKDNLESLKAPQTSFGVNSLAALAKCDHLRVLDLSLVTESIPILDFFRVIQKLDTLKILHLPRASLSPPKEGPGTRASAYPRNLAQLIIPGRVSRILSAHAPSDILHIESLHLQEVPLDYWDLAYLTKVTASLPNLTLREPVNRSTGFEQGVWDAMLDHFGQLKSLRLEYFSSLYHLFSSADDEEGDIPAAFGSLEELIIGPVPVGAELLRATNRPFDITSISENEETDLLEFVEKLPRLRRLVLVMHERPTTVLQDLHSDYIALSSALKSKSRLQEDFAEDSGAPHRLSPAGVFWTTGGPPFDITGSDRAQMRMYRLT